MPTPATYPPSDPATTPHLSQWPTSRQGFTRRDVLGLLFKHKWVILATFLLVSVIVWLGLAMLPSTFVAKAKILIRVEQQGSPSFLSGIAAYREPTNADPAGRKLETEMGLLTARPIAEEVARKLNLEYGQIYHAPYIHYLEPLTILWSYIEAWLYEKPRETSLHGFGDTVVELGRALEVKTDTPKTPEATPNIVEVTLKAPGRQLAVDTLSEVVDTYIREGSALDRASGEEALAIVTRNLDETRQRVAALDAEMRRVLTSTGLSVSDVATAGGGDAAATPSRPTIAESRSPSPRPPGAADGASSSPGRTAMAGESGSAAGSGADSGSGSASGDANVVKLLRTRLAEAELQLATERSVYTDRSERVTQIKATVVDLRRRVTEESARNADAQVRLKILMREQAAEESGYLDLSKKLDQIHLFLQLEPTQLLNRKLLEAPVAPKTSEWRRSLVIGIAGSFAGLFLGLALAAIREYFDHRLGTVADAESYLGVPVLGIFPDVPQRRLRAAMPDAGRGPPGVP